jgi:hypothetical protein
MGASAALIEAGAEFAAEAVFGKSVRKATKKVAKAQENLVKLKAEEQRIRNAILRQSLTERDGTLPFEISGPGLGPNGYGTNTVPVQGQTGTGGPEPKLASAGVIGIVVIIGAAIALMWRG